MCMRVIIFIVFCVSNYKVSYFFQVLLLTNCIDSGYNMCATLIEFCINIYETVQVLFLV